MNLTILVGSCDRYSFLWDFFFRIYYEKFIDIDVQIKLISETIKYDNPNIETILCGNVSYTKCIETALNNIETGYVMWLQEDYIFTDIITSTELNKYMVYIESNKLDRFGLHENSKYYTTKKLPNGYFKMLNTSDYLISMQVSIWDKMFLKSLIVADESPWSFELNGSNRIKNTNTNIQFVEKKWFADAMIKGKPTKLYQTLKEKYNF